MISYQITNSSTSSSTKTTAINIQTTSNGANVFQEGRRTMALVLIVVCYSLKNRGMIPKGRRYRARGEYWMLSSIHHHCWKIGSMQRELKTQSRASHVIIQGSRGANSTRTTATTYLSMKTWGWQIKVRKRRARQTAAVEARTQQDGFFLCWLSRKLKQLQEFKSNLISTTG